METTKYLIIGTGGVGGSIAAFLALAGHNVTCIARGAHLKAMRKNGLMLKSGLKGEHTVRVNACWISTPDYAQYIYLNAHNGLLQCGKVK